MAKAKTFVLAYHEIPFRKLPTAELIEFLNDSAEQERLYAYKVEVTQTFPLYAATLTVTIQPKHEKEVLKELNDKFMYIHC